MLSPYAKAALFVIRLAACGLIILGGMLCAQDLVLYFSPKPHPPVSRPAVLALKAAPALAGLALYAKSKAIAIHLTKDLD
jgi:hypothetical protein